MKIKLILGLFLILLFVSNQITEAQSGRQIELTVNQEKKIPKSELTIKFVSVVEDSRCPVDADCVWAGNAKVRISIKKAKAAWQTFELNSNLPEKAVKFAGCKIELINLDPKPRTNIRINRNGYTATFAVELLK